MSILQTIGATKRDEVARLKRERGLDSLRQGAASQAPPRDFFGAVARPGKLSLIGELKKASPSKGVLKADFDVRQLAPLYAKAGARALSVLTDVQYFQGDLSYLKQAQAASGLPVLRKDFLIDEHQVYEAREAGADAILLIVAMLSGGQLKELQQLAGELGMTVLVEVHDEAELDAALKASVKLLGINNRNLNDFKVDLQTSLRLMKGLPAGLPVVSESGIFTREDARSLKEQGASAILVGEAFMTAPDLPAAVRALLPEGD
ncbi:MAG TPA: indole-3-glycerol phosphate synthase TrpC [bacterium]|nr:indole-3-glycerol phosphate synthase TrpC [bacterium]